MSHDPYRNGTWQSQSQRHRQQPSVAPPRPKTTSPLESSSHRHRSRSINAGPFDNPIVEDDPPSPRYAVPRPSSTRPHHSPRSRSQQVPIDPYAPPVPSVPRRRDEWVVPADPPGFYDNQPMRLLYGPEKRLVTAKEYDKILGIQNPKLPGPLYDPRPFEAPIPFHYDPNPVTLQGYEPPPYNGMYQPHPKHPKSPPIEDQRPQKPLLKRMFGRSSRTPAPPPIPPTSPSRQSSESRRRSRTKSFS
ncbi:hypothetical protein DL96DRAFT_1628017 [Flagelloscypha sp. PMI_526]|nr:hypothetical protein DL96DRAFT_1628017 [Flagelloscypha sp. PMI_526]